MEKSEGEKRKNERERESREKKEEEGAEWRREENPRRERWNRRNAVTRMLHRASERGGRRCDCRRLKRVRGVVGEYRGREGDGKKSLEREADKEG